jgi:NTE family protein
VIHVSEGGPGEVSAGIHYDSDYGITFPLYGAFRNVLSKNSKFFADINIAINPRIRAEYLQGFGGKAAAGVKGEFYTFKIDLYEKDAKVNKLDLTNYKASAYFNYNFRNLVNMKAGFDYEYFRFRQEIVIDSSLVPFENFSSYGTLFFSLNADTRDKPYYPSRGIRSLFRAEYVFPLSKNWSSELFSNSLIMYAKFEDNLSLNKDFVLQPGLFAGAMLRSMDAPPVQHWFGLGGMTPDNYISTFVPFTGLHFIQQFGNYSLIGRMKLQYNAYKKIYLYLMADAGATEMDFNGLFDGRNFLAGYGVKASYNSFIGPLEFSVMGSNINPGLMFFLNLGYWF